MLMVGTTALDSSTKVMDCLTMVIAPDSLLYPAENGLKMCFSWQNTLLIMFLSMAKVQVLVESKGLTAEMVLKDPAWMPNSFWARSEHSWSFLVSTKVFSDSEVTDVSQNPLTSFSCTPSLSNWRVLKIPGEKWRKCLS